MGMQEEVAVQRKDHVRKWSVRTIGGFSIETSRGEKLEVKSRKARGIIGYLALSRNASASREQIAGMFWSDRGEEQARASLRQCLKQLRKQCEEVGISFLKVNRDEVTLDRRVVDLDLAVIIKDLETGHVREDLITGERIPERILYGYEGLDQSFSSWLRVVRQNWHDRIVDVLQRILYAENVPLGESMAAANALIRIDATHEEAYRHLIREYAGQGNTPAALRLYKTLWEHLDEDFDMEPDDETLGLIAEIKAGTYDPPAEGRALAPVNTPWQNASLAPIAPAPTKPILPVISVAEFSRGSNAEAPAYLIDGFRRDLIACLVRFREWMIVEPESSAASATGHVTDEEDDWTVVGQVYALECTAYEDADSTHFIITLKDQQSRQFIWSERYVLALENWFTAQQEIVRRISVALNIYLSVERLSRLAGQPDISLDIYDRWLRGHSMTYKWDPDVRDQASEIFKSIVKACPTFAPGYSSLVQTYNSRHLMFPGIFRSTELERHALQLARRAVDIDPLDTSTQLCLAWSNVMNNQFEQAELNYLLARDLNANNPWTIVSSAMGLAFCGSYEKAGELAEEALNLGLQPSPAQWLYQSNIAFLRGDLESSVASAKKAGPVTLGCLAWRAASHVHLDELDEARKTGEEFMQRAHQNWKGSGPASDEEIGRWIFTAYPIGDQSARERLRTGMIAAGIPAQE